MDVFVCEIAEEDFFVYIHVCVSDIFSPLIRILHKYPSTFPSCQPVLFIFLGHYSIHSPLARTHDTSGTLFVGLLYVVL